MGLGSDTHVRIRKFLGNFLMGNLQIMKSALPTRIFSACGREEVAQQKIPQKFPNGGQGI